MTSNSFAMHNLLRFIRELVINNIDSSPVSVHGRLLQVSEPVQQRVIRARCPVVSLIETTSAYFIRVRLKPRD